jgi:hypothetical protein
MSVWNFARGMFRFAAGLLILFASFVLVEMDLSSATVGFVLTCAMLATGGLFTLSENYRYGSLPVHITPD